MAHRRCAHAPHEAALVQAVVGLADAARRRLPGRAARETAADACAISSARRVAQFAGQFQHHVAAQRKARQERRCAPFLREIRAARPAGRWSGRRGRASGRGVRCRRRCACETVRGETRAAARAGQAPYVAGLARALQAVHHHDLAPRPRRAGRCESHQHLHSGSVRNKPALDGKLGASQSGRVQKWPAMVCRCGLRNSGSKGAMERGNL